MSDTTNVRKLTIQRIEKYLNAYASLDGHVEVTFDDEGKPLPRSSTKTTPYHFGKDGKGGGKVRHAIIKNMRILSRHLEDFTKARDAILVDISGGSGQLKPTDEGYADKLTRYQTEVSDLLKEEIDIFGLLAIQLDDLNLDSNELLPNTTVTALEDLVVDSAPVA